MQTPFIFKKQKKIAILENVLYYIMFVISLKLLN